MEEKKTMLESNAQPPVNLFSGSCGFSTTPKSTRRSRQKSLRETRDCMPPPSYRQVIGFISSLLL